MCAFSPPLPCAEEGPGLKGDRFMDTLEDVPGHDDDVYDYMAERLHRTRETENSGVS